MFSDSDRSAAQMVEKAKAGSGEVATKRVAMITGASRGIGAACARALGADGYAVVLASRAPGPLHELEEELSQRGVEALCVPTDVGEEKELERLVAAATERFGGIDLLVNNAGFFPPQKEISEVSVEEWDAAQNVMLRAPWYLSKLMHPIMEQRGGGCILNMSSVSGLRHNPLELLYTMPKSGLVMLTKICAKEWATANIRVNCIAPGWVRTEMAASFLDTLGPDDRINMLNIALEPPEVAQLVVYLASPHARAITGEVIRIDGGAFGLF